MKDSKALPHSPASSKISALIFGGCFLFFFLIMLCAPYSYDDYEFAALTYSSPLELFLYCLRYGNGRFLATSVRFYLRKPLQPAHS